MTNLTPMVGAILTGLLTIGLLILGACTVIRMANEAQKVHDDLEKFNRRAIEAKTKDELYALRSELIDYYTKYCYNRHYANHARQVDMFIVGRLRGCP